MDDSKEDQRLPHRYEYHPNSLQRMCLHYSAVRCSLLFSNSFGGVISISLHSSCFLLLLHAGAHQTSLARQRPCSG